VEPAKSVRHAGAELLPLALRRRAAERKDQTAFTFLSERGETRQRYTYGELDRCARAIAAALQEQAEPGARVALLFRPGLEFLAAFMGCQYAAMVAVPVQPPTGLPLRRRALETPAARSRLLGNLQKFASIVEDAEVAAVLTTSGLAESAADMAELVPAVGMARWIAVDEIDHSRAGFWRQPVWQADRLSLLQYTSGSTSSPKGVAVTHQHLAGNAAAIRQLARFDPARDVGVSWLPAYHDMGLVGNMLQQVFEGYPQILLSPMAFLKRPLSWLQAISTHRATLSAAPNFAFDLCVAKATTETVAELDLASLRVVVVGAEPIRTTTMDRFARTFEPHGFRAEALHPCYGLAESTLIVTGRKGVRTVYFDNDGLRRGRARTADEGTDRATPLVSCGRPLADAEILIVDPETREPRPDGQIGEIWVSSGHVAAGYFGQPGATRATFEARPVGDSDKSFLRTGDAGVLHEQELFVTGRYKDVMIFGGANHHPHDIEQTVTDAHEAIGSDRAVAFSAEVDGTEKLVVGVELRGVPEEDRAVVASAIRQKILTQHGLSIHALVTLRRGGLPRTSSGKLQRYLARQRFELGELGEAT
jgi:acyl-CoA synthetase (AMP-forming)/AMP-acid ligase II